MCVCVCARASLCVYPYLCGRLSPTQPAGPGVHVTVGVGTGAPQLTLPPAGTSGSANHLINPAQSSREYLSCIFVSILTGTLPWQGTWLAQILSALAWAQCNELWVRQNERDAGAAQSSVLCGPRRTLCARCTASVTACPVRDTTW